MPTIKIETTQEEQTQVLGSLKQLEGKTVSVSQVAKHAGMNQNRVRYVIADLVDLGKVERIPTKAFNEHYKRYSYKVLTA